MEVVSLCPFRAVGLVWQPRPSAFSLLLVCKATFDLVPGAARLAEIQDYPNEEDNHWDDDAKRSLYSATDLVPSKPRADVLLVGHAFAPYGQEVDSFVTRLVVGDVAKAIEVVSERVWTMEPHVRYGSRITKASLRYERASGGEGTWNPVGLPLDPPPDAFGMTPLPALQPPGFMVVRRGEPIPPVGYGPLAPSWPTRRERLGRHAATFNPARWHLAPLPSDIDPAFFNAAPEDQQTSEIHAEERIELLNLHPDVPHLVTTLPGVKPRVFVERPGKPPEEVLMRGDTLWIDTDRQIATLTWRGQIALAARDEIGRAIVAMEPPGRTLSFLDINRMLGRPTGPSQPGDDSQDSAIEWVEPEESVVADRPSSLGRTGAGATTSAAAGATTSATAGATTSAAPAAGHGAIADGATLVGIGPATTAAPAAPIPAAAHPPAIAPAPAPAAVPPLAPASDTPLPGSSDPSAIGTPIPVSTSAIDTPFPVSLSAIETPLPGTPGAASTPILGTVTAARAARRYPSAPPPGDQDKEFPTEERPVRASGVPREGVHLLWFDADADAVAARIGPVAIEGSARTALVSPSRAPSAPRSLTTTIEAAIGPDGRFEPPPVTLTGDLSLTLAPLERLRALLTVAAVLEPADERAASLRQKGERLLAGPSPEGAGWLAGRIADDLEAAMAARAGAPDSLAGARRALHAARAYVRALVLGGRKVRGLLRDAGGATLAVYISEDACVHLPLDERFRARVVGELYPRVDATDPAPFAIRVVGIARILALR